MTELRGTGVLVTRPGAGGEELAQLIESAGGRARLYPALVIQAAGQDQVPGTDAGAVAHWYVFVSPHAADYGVDWLRAQGRLERLTGARVAAVGGGTARRLEMHGCHDVLVPPAGTGSQALLQHPRLQQLEGQRVLVFRGQSGSEALRDELSRRGARVDFASVYRRGPPSQPLTRATLAGMDIVITTSTEALSNLCDAAQPDAGPLLRQLALVVSSPRAAALAVARGWRNSPIITPLVSNPQIVRSISAWKTSQRQTRPR